MTKFDQSYHRVATLAEAAAEDTSQAAKRATIHAMMKGDDNAETLCGRYTREQVKRMGVIRIVDCPECREKLIEANRKQTTTSFAKWTDIGSPLSQRIADMTPEQKQAMLMQIDQMQASGEWDRMVQAISAEVANRKQTTDRMADTIKQSNIERDAATMNKLRACCGYVENGSQEPLTISQDECTKGWSIRIGTERIASTVPLKMHKPRSYHAAGFHEVIDMAYAVEKQEI